MSNLRQQSIETTRVDPSTGEIITSTVERTFKVKTDSSDEFFMIYYNLLVGFTEIKRAGDIHLLIKLCSMAEFNTGIVVISTAVRAQLCEYLGVKSSNLSSSIKRLKDAKLITGDKGTYEINPSIFWKGDAPHRKEKLKVCFEFN